MRFQKGALFFALFNKRCAMKKDQLKSAAVSAAPIVKEF
jgi:hypothetical protein